MCQRWRGEKDNGFTYNQRFVSRISMTRATIRSRGIRETVYVVRYGERWCENAVPRWFSRRNRIKIVASSIGAIQADEIAPSYLPSAILDRRARDTRAEPAMYANFSSYVDPTDGHVRSCTLVAILQGPASIAREKLLFEKVTRRDYRRRYEISPRHRSVTRWKIVGKRGKRGTRGSTRKKKKRSRPKESGRKREASFRARRARGLVARFRPPRRSTVAERNRRKGRKFREITIEA